MMGMSAQRSIATVNWVVYRRRITFLVMTETPAPIVTTVLTVIVWDLGDLIVTMETLALPTPVWSVRDVFSLQMIKRVMTIMPVLKMTSAPKAAALAATHSIVMMATHVRRMDVTL